MNPGVVAGISFSDGVMRYAEVEHERHGSTLRRLGSCRFDFTVTDSLKGYGDDAAYRTLSEAVAEIFSDTPAHLLSVALDPRLSYAFETSIAHEADDAALTSQVLRELALVADDETPLFVRTENAGSHTMKDGADFSDIRVFAMPQQIKARLQGLADTLGVGLGVSTSVAASSAMVGFLEDPFRATESAYSVVVGDQVDHVEFAVCVQGRLVSTALAAVSHRADCAFAMWSFIRRLGLSPTDLDTIYLYGEGERDSVFDDVPRKYGVTLRRLSPLDVVRLQAGSGGERELAAYVPCVGAALEAIV